MRTEVRELSFRMKSTLEAETSNGRITISFPETAVSPEAREDFISFLKTEWALRQSRFTADEAESLADEVDAGWWAANKDRLLAKLESA